MKEWFRTDRSGETADKIAEATEHIQDLWERGVRPTVTVPQEYAAALQAGLRKHATWVPGFDAIVGTMGRDPYLPAGENRILVRVNPESIDRIHPRFTGKDLGFHGVVVLDGPIAPDEIEVINTTSIH